MIARSGIKLALNFAGSDRELCYCKPGEIDKRVHNQSEGAFATRIETNYETCGAGHHSGFLKTTIISCYS